jgi:hypothetical protein
MVNRMADEIREYIFQLHRSGPAHGQKWDEVDWDSNAVGEPVRFAAKHYGEQHSGWRPIGPVVVKATEALADDVEWSARPTYTVRTAVDGRFVLGNYVGRSLNEGDEFTLPNEPIMGVPRGGNA